jgi:hypothetical protein
VWWGALGAFVVLMIAAGSAPALPKGHGGHRRRHTAKVHTVARPSTVELRPSQIRSVLSGPSGTVRIGLAPGVKSPAPGHVVVVAPTAKAPEGVLGTVTASRRLADGVSQIVTSPATLESAYSSYRIKVETDLGETALPEPDSGPATGALEGVEAHGSVATASGLGSFLPKFVCKGAALKHPISTRVDLSDLHLLFEVTSQPSIELLLTGTPRFDLGVAFSGKVTCTAESLIPVPIGDTGLLVEIGPKFTFDAQGAVDADFDWTPHLTLGFVRSAGGGNSDAHVMRSDGSVSFDGEAGVDLSLALETKISLAGRVGVTGTVGPDVSADYSASRRCLTATGSVKADLTAFADVLFKKWSFTLYQGSFGSTELYNSCSGQGGTNGGGGSHPPAFPPLPGTPAPPAGPVSTGTPGVGSYLDWSASHVADRHEPFTSGDYLGDIACPTEGLCVAIGEFGDATVSTDPTGGPAAWSTFHVDLGGSRSISCPSASFCVAAGGTGISVSTDPGGGTGAWSEDRLDYVQTGFTEDISCASSLLCVGVANDGSIIASANPAGGPDAWTNAKVDGSGIDSVACPSAGLCAAVDSAGNLLTSTDPTAGAWTFHAIDSGVSLSSIACPSTGFCLAADMSGRVFPIQAPFSASPTVGVEQLAPFGSGRYLQTKLVCTSTSRCIATDASDHVFVTNEASNPSGSWTAYEGAGGSGFLSALACVGSLCLSAQTEGALLSSHDLAAGAAGWTHQVTVGYSPPTSISCPGAGLCVGVNTGGDVFASSDPGSPSPSWTVFPELDQGEFTHVLRGVDCPDEGFCIAVGDDGKILTSTAPLAGAASWSTTELPGSTDLTAVSCPSPTACVVTDQDGTIYSSTDPLGGASTWSPSFADPGGGLDAISCPSAGFCVAVDGRGNAVVSATPFAVGGWTHFRVDQNNFTDNEVVQPEPLVGISCPSAGMCLAVGSFSGLISSQDPTGGSAGWNTGYLDGPNFFPAFFQAVSCPTTSFCALGGSGEADEVWTSVDPGAGTAGGWLVEDVSPSSPFYGISALSCPSADFCAAADFSGDVVTGAG